MIVHHARGLHESVADRRPDESEAALDEIAAHRARGVGRGGTLAVPTPGVLRRLAADELPDVLVERAVLALDLEERARVGDRRLDLGPVTDDARVTHETLDPS